VIAAAAVLGSVIVESLAVYVCAEWIAGAYAHSQQHAIAAWVFVAVSLVSFGTPRLVEFFALSRKTTAAVTLAIAFVTFYGAVRLEFAGDLALWNFGWAADFIRDAEATTRAGNRAIIGVLLLLALWIRAAIRSHDETDLDWIPRSVTAPFAIVTTVVVLAAAGDRSGEVARAGAAFYAVAVMTLACSQLALSGTTFGELRAGGTTAMLLGGAVAATIACVVVFGIAFAVLAPVLGPPIGRAIEFVLVILLTPPAWLLSHLFDLLMGGASPLKELPQSTLDAAQNTKDPEAHHRSPWGQAGLYAMRGLALVVIAGAVAGVVVLLARLRRRIRELRAGGPETTTSGSLGEDARNLLRSLFGRGPRGGEGGAGVYRLYSDVLHQAARRGHERRPGQTPSEFAPELGVAFQAPVTDEITAAFEQARYAGREPDAHTLAELERRWRSSV
jgi:hypothetical protein